MSSVYANIQVNLNTASAVANLKALQKQANTFASNINAANAAQVKGAATALQTAAVASGAFTARMLPATGAVQSFNEHLLKNRFSLGDYARYSAAATKETGYFHRALKNTGALTAQTSMINQVATQRVQTLATQYVALGKSVTGANQVMALTPTILNTNTAKMQMALEKQRLMNMLIADGSTKMLNWGKNMQWAGRQLMVGFTLPLTLFAGIAISVFNDMEKQALEFKKVYGDLFTTEPEMQQNLKAVKELGLEFTKYGIALKDTMKMATTAAASGQQNADLIAATTEATRLQVLGQMEAQSAMATTISLQTAFKLSNTQLTESINFLNAVENQTVLTLQDITEAIPRVATVINSFGGGVKELSVLLVGMKEGGVSAEQGANALKNSLARLITPTSRAKEMTAAFGINLESIVKNNRGQLIPMLTELAEKLDGLGGTQRQEVLSTLFGKYQYARIGVMLQSLTDKSSQASRAMKLVDESTKDLAETAERELGRVEDSTSSKFKSVVEKMKAGLIPIGEEFLKAAMPILETIGKIIEWFNGMGETIKQTIVTITTIVGIIAPTFLMMLGLFGNLIAQGIKTIQFLRRMAATIAGNGKAWQRLTLEELEAQTMSNALSKQTVNTTGALMSQVQAIGMLNRELALYIVELQKAAIASAALAGAGRPAMLGKIKKVKPPAMLNDGGKVFDSSTSTYVPGTGNKDTVPAVLTPGEFVVNKQATKENLPILHAINNGDAVQRNKGGMIPGVQYFARNRRQRVVKKDPEIRTPKPPASIPISPTPMWRGSNAGSAATSRLPFGGLSEKVNLRKNLLTESSRLHSLLESLWSNRSRAGARTTLNPEGLLRPPTREAPRISIRDDGEAQAWVYGQKNIDGEPWVRGGDPRLRNRIFVNRPDWVQRDIEFQPGGKLHKRSPGEILPNANASYVSATLQHEMFHLGKPKEKYNSSKQQGREEAKAVVAQSTVQGRLGAEDSYQQIARTMREGWAVSPSRAKSISQEFGDEFLRHIMRTEMHRGRDIGNIRDFYQTTRRQRARGIPTGPGSRTQVYSQQGYAEVRRDAALAKIFDAFTPISKQSNPKLYREITRAAKRRGIPQELFVHEVGNREMIQTSALLMNARSLGGSKPFNDIFMKLLDSGLRRKTTGLEKFFGGRGSQTRQDPMDRNVINQLVDDVTNPSFQSIRDANLYNQRFNQGGIIPGYAGGGRVLIQAKKGLAKFNQEKFSNGQSLLTSARAGLNEAQSRYGVIHRNYDTNPAIDFLRNVGVLKPDALKQDVWNRVKNVRSFGGDRPELIAPQNEIYMKKNIRSGMRQRLPQITDPNYYTSYSDQQRRSFEMDRRKSLVADSGMISQFTPIRINTASTKKGLDKIGMDTYDAGYSMSAMDLNWARGKKVKQTKGKKDNKDKKDTRPGIYINPEARKGEYGDKTLFDLGIVEHEYSHQSRGIKLDRKSGPVEEARAMATEMSVTNIPIPFHYLSGQQRQLQGRGAIQDNARRQDAIESILKQTGYSDGQYSATWVRSFIDEVKRLETTTSISGISSFLGQGVMREANRMATFLTKLDRMPRVTANGPQGKRLLESVFGPDNKGTYSAKEVYAAGIINPIFSRTGGVGMTRPTGGLSQTQSNRRESAPQYSQALLLSLIKKAGREPVSGSRDAIAIAAMKPQNQTLDAATLLREGLIKTRGFNTGDIVPGMGSKDTVPAMLTPGEFVVNKQSTQSNLGLLHQINNGNTPPELQGFNKGGIIPGVQYFGGGGQSRKGGLEFLHLFDFELADKALSDRIRATTDNELVKHSKDTQFRLYNNMGIVGPKKMQHATGAKLSTLFTPELMDRTMGPFYKAIASELGRTSRADLRAIRKDPAIRSSVHEFGRKLGDALATQAGVVTSDNMKQIVAQAAQGNATMQKAIAHASQMTTIGYNRPTEMPDHSDKGKMKPILRPGEHERAPITLPQQRGQFNSSQPFTSYTSWWGKKGDKFIRDTTGAPGSAGSAQPTGQAAAGPQPKARPAPLGAMPPPLNIVPTETRKEIQKRIDAQARETVTKQIREEALRRLPQQRSVDGTFMPRSGPVEPTKPNEPKIGKTGAITARQQRGYDKRMRAYNLEMEKYRKDEKKFNKALNEQYGKLYKSMKGRQLIDQERQKLGKEAMKEEKKERKRQAKLAAQTDDIGKNNARLIAQQRDAIMAANPALTSKQATDRARRLVLPQPERAPKEPKPTPRQPTTPNQKARDLMRRQFGDGNTGSKSQVERAQGLVNQLQRQSVTNSGAMPMLPVALALAQKELTRTTELRERRAKLQANMERRAARTPEQKSEENRKGGENRQRIAQSINTILAAQGHDYKKLSEQARTKRGVPATPEQVRAGQLIAAATEQARSTIMAPMPTPPQSRMDRVKGAIKAPVGKARAFVTQRFTNYNNAWQDRDPSRFRSGSVPVLDDEGKPTGQKQKAQSKMQKGAGKAAGGVGTIGMMASMMPMFMQDDKGKFMGMDPMAAMGGIMGASILAQGLKAMIGSATAAVATAGMALGGIAVAAVAAGIAIKMWRDSVNSSAKAAAELGANLGGAANAANKIGKVMGIDTPAQRQAKMQMGFLGEEQKLANDRFGQALSSDQGKAFVEELKKGTTAQRISKTQDYMSTAIATKQLTVEDAKLFTKTLATALGDPVMGTAVVRSISSAMASPNAMEKLADKRLAAVTTVVPPNIETAIDAIKNAPAIGTEGFQKSIATDVSAFAIGSAVQVIQDYSNVIAMTREQYQQGIITFEKYNSTITRATAIQNEYAGVLSKAVGGAFDMQGARQALDSQLVAGGMSQEQVDAITHATDIGVSGGGIITTLFNAFGQGGVSAYQSDFIARGANKMGISDSQLTPDQLSKLKEEAQSSEEAAKKMFEGGLNENLKAAVLAGKMTAEAATALGTQLMNNSRGAGATQYQKMAEQGQGVLGLEQAGFIDTTNALGVKGLEDPKKMIQVGLNFSSSGGSLAEYQTFFNSLAEKNRKVYVDILARTTYEGQTEITSGYTALTGAIGENNAAKVAGLRSSVEMAKSTKNVYTSVTLPTGKGERPREKVVATADLSDYKVVNDARVALGEKFGPGSEDLIANIILAAETTQNGKLIDPEQLAQTTEDLGDSVDFIYKNLPEEVIREINLNTTDPESIKHWNDVSKSFVDGWLTLSQLNPNIKMSAVVEFLTVDENGPIDEKTRAERVNSLNDAYSDLEKSKDVNIRKEAYITLGTAQIRDKFDNELIPEEFMNDTLDSLVKEFGGGVLQLDPIVLMQTLQPFVDASKLREKANAILASDPGPYGEIIAKRMLNDADMWESGGKASLGVSLNNLNNSKSGGGGGGGKKKETPIKDMNKGFLEQIKMYTNMDANLKRLNDARGKFAASLTKGKGIIQKLREAGISEGIISQLASKGFDALKKGYDKFVTKGRANALGRNENELARIATVASGRGSVATAVKNAENQTRAAKVLRGMEGTAKEVKGMTLNAEELSQALDDPVFADAFSRISTKKGRAEVQAYVNDVLKARPVLEKAMREMSDPRLLALDDISKLETSINAEIALKTEKLTQDSEEKFRSDYKMTKAQADLQIAKNQMEIDSIQLEIDKKKESNDLDQHSIDLLEHSKKQWKDKIDLVQASIDAYQKSIDAYQRENEMRNQQANVINHSLDIMSKQETQITDAYNKRIDALDEVARINDYIINQQASQLNLAQALSQGDVYGAAAAQQTMQTGTAQFAQDQMRAGLQTGMENQIAGLTTGEGLTRVQAEAELNRIKEMNYQNDLLVTALQNQIYIKTQEMIPYKDEIASIDKDIATYTETIWQRNNDIYNIQVGQIEPLQKANEELDRKLQVSNDQLAIDVKEAALQYDTQLALLDLTAKGIELSLAQEEAAGAVAAQWKNILDLITAANKALEDKKTEANKLKLLPTTSAAQAKANIAAAKLISDEASAKYAKEIARIKEMMIISVPAAAANKAAGGVIGDGGRDSVAAMLTPGEFVMRKASVQKYGMPMLSKMNMGAFEMPRYNTQQPIITSIHPTSSTTKINAPVYNTYSVNVSANTNASADDIANTVMTKIKRVDSMAVRSFRGY